MKDNYKKLDEGYLLTLDNKKYWLNRKVISHISEGHFFSSTSYDSVFKESIDIEKILELILSCDRKEFSEGFVFTSKENVGYNCFSENLNQVDGVLVKKGRHMTILIPCQINENIGNDNVENNGKTNDFTLILQDSKSVRFSKGFDFRSDPNHKEELQKLNESRELGLVVTIFPGSVFNASGLKQPRAYSYVNQGFYVSKKNENFLPLSYESDIVRNIVRKINESGLKNKKIMSKEEYKVLIETTYQKHILEKEVKKIIPKNIITLNNTKI